MWLARSSRAARRPRRTAWCLTKNWSTPASSRSPQVDEYFSGQPTEADIGRVLPQAGRDQGRPGTAVAGVDQRHPAAQARDLDVVAHARRVGVGHGPAEGRRPQPRTGPLLRPGRVLRDGRLHRPPAGAEGLSSRAQLRGRSRGPARWQRSAAGCGSHPAALFCCCVRDATRLALPPPRPVPARGLEPCGLLFHHVRLGELRDQVDGDEAQRDRDDARVLERDGGIGRDSDRRVPRRSGRTR